MDLRAPQLVQALAPFHMYTIMKAEINPLLPTGFLKMAKCKYSGKASSI
jgi:hypothetical protein